MIETAREREKEKEQGKGKGEQKQSFFSGNAMTNGLSERLTPFHSLALSPSFSVSRSVLLFVPLQLGQLEMLIAEMKYFGDKRVPDEPPL